MNYLISRLGQEIAHARGGRREFSPNWKLPQRFQQYVRNELPLWLFHLLLAVVASGLFFAYHWLLRAQTLDFADSQRRPGLTAPLFDKAESSPKAASPQADKPRTVM